MDCSLPGSSVHEILQARIWSGLSCPPPWDLPDPRIEAASLMSPALTGGFFTTSTTWEAQTSYTLILKSEEEEIPRMYLQRKGHVSTQWEVSHLWVKERGLRRNHPYWYLDLGSRTMRNKFLMFKQFDLWHFIKPALENKYSYPHGLLWELNQLMED